MTILRQHHDPRKGRKRRDCMSVLGWAIFWAITFLPLVWAISGGAQ